MRTASPALLSDYLGDAAGHGSVRTTPSPARTAPTVSVIIPTLNEAGNLPYVLNTIPRWVDEIVIVDGRSSDDTARIAQGAPSRREDRPPDAQGQGRRAARGTRLRSRRAADHHGRRRLDGRSRHREVPRRAGRRRGLRQGQPLLRRRRLDRHHAASPDRRRRHLLSHLAVLRRQVHRRHLRFQGHVGGQPRRDPHRHRRVRGRAARSTSARTAEGFAPPRSPASRPIASMAAATSMR